MRETKNGLRISAKNNFKKIIRNLWSYWKYVNMSREAKPIFSVSLNTYK